MKKLDLDTLPGMGLTELIDMALEVDDRSQFWLLAGAITGKACVVEAYKSLTGLLWDAGHVQPDGDYELAFRTLRQLRLHEQHRTTTETTSS